MPQTSEGRSPLADRGEKQPLKKGARADDTGKQNNSGRGKDYTVQSTGQTQLRSS
jgi:hypothetical protein